MTCKRCGVEYTNPTETMAEYELCINCVMEYHRKKPDMSLSTFAETERESHFKI